MKKGMELSINFLVMLILAVVVFGFGIKFIYQIADMGKNTADALTNDQQRELENALNEGKRVAISLNNKPAYPGQSVVYGLGIMNIEDTANCYHITLGDVTGVERNGVTPITVADQKLKFFNNIERDIVGKSDAKLPILVTVNPGAPAGTYQIIVSVYQCQHTCPCTPIVSLPSNLYSQKQTIYVTVS